MKKLLVLGIIVLFVAVNIIPSTGNLVKKSNSPIELIIDGPSYGKVGESLEYFLILTGPEGYEVWFFIDWDDGSQTDWFGPFITGEYALASHIWNECGVYTIQVTAKCNGSYYNASLEVTINYMNIIGVTVYEAWELLNDTSNGIQIPIDIRYDEEWNESFIDTPYPENAVHFSIDLLKTEEGMHEFLDKYTDKEIVLYGKSNAYTLMIYLYILLSYNYTGTIYQWGGGLTEWINAGLPVRNNTAPDAPGVWHEHSKGKPTIDFTRKYYFKTIDPDGDNIWLYILWGDGYTEGWVGPYNSGEEVTLNHTYAYMGTYTVKAKARDIFGVEGPWGEEVIPMEDGLTITKPEKAIYANNQKLIPFLMPLVLCGNIDIEIEAPGTFDRMEIFINDILIDTITGPGPFSIPIFKLDGKAFSKDKIEIVGYTGSSQSSDSIIVWRIFS